MKKLLFTLALATVMFGCSKTELEITDNQITKTDMSKAPVMLNSDTPITVSPTAIAGKSGDIIHVTVYNITNNDDYQVTSYIDMGPYQSHADIYIMNKTATGFDVMLSYDAPLSTPPVLTGGIVLQRFNGTSGVYPYDVKMFVSIRRTE